MKNVLLCAYFILISTVLIHADTPLNPFEREHLFDSWGGLRPMLEEKGLIYDLIYTGEYFENVSGGIKEGGDYKGDLSLFLEWDTETAGVWENGTFYVHLQESHGYGITDRFVGDYQVLSNIDADDFFQVSEIWYKHTFLDEALWIKLGKMEANEDFAFVEYGGEFIHSSPGFSPTMPLPSYPDQDWGVVFAIAPQDSFSMNLGLYQGRNDGGRSIGNTIDNLYGPMIMAEPSYHYAWGNNPGHFRAGAWWNGDRETTLNPSRYDDNYGWYLTWDQLAWKENQESDDDQGIGVFAQYGWAPEERWDTEQYAGAGFQWTGALPTRDSDILGLGVFNVFFSDNAGFAKDTETAFELFYRYQAMGWFTLKPELQYITNPGGTNNDDAFVAGLRAEISF